MSSKIQLTAERAALAEAMAWAAHAVPRRPSFPALAGVRLTATRVRGGGTLTLEAFDFETGHRVTIPAKVSYGGEALVSGHMAAALIGALRGESVDLSLEDGVVTLKAGRSRYRLNTLPLEEYPMLPELEGDPVGEVDAGELRAALATVSWPIDENNPTQRLRGVRLQIDGPDLSVLGCHSSGVAAARIPFPGDLEVWLPSGTLERSLKGLDGPVAVRVTEGTIRLSTPARDTFLRLYSPDPVPWRQFLPAASPTTLEVDAGQLREAVSRASITCADNQAVTLTLTEGEVTVSAGGADVAEGQEVLDASITGPPLTIHFGPMLSKALAALPDGPVTIGLSDPLKPALITDKADTWAFVIMPRRAA